MSHTDEVIARMCDALQAESDSDLARSLGTRPSTISSWRLRESVPYAECVKLSKRTGLSIDWLITGETPRQRAAFAAIEKALGEPVDQEGMIRVQLYEIHAAAGNGSITADHPELIRHFDFPEWWLRNVVRVLPKAVQVLIAWGDSMKPDVLPGDLLIVDTSHDSVQADCLYVFEMDGGVFIKKLQRLPGGRLKVISANPDYEAYTITPANDASFKVVGRVAFHGKVT